jgi:hypothetical protein
MKTILFMAAKINDKTIVAWRTLHYDSNIKFACKAVEYSIMGT